MAGSVNKVIILGNLGAPPELKYLPSGQAVCEMRIATSEVFKDKNDQRQERTEWHKIVVWGKTGENCAKFLGKGRQVYLEGRLQTRTWDDKDGNKRYTTEIVADNVVFLRDGSGGQGQGQGQGMSGGDEGGAPKSSASGSYGAAAGGGGTGGGGYSGGGRSYGGGGGASSSGGGGGYGGGAPASSPSGGPPERGRPSAPGPAGPTDDVPHEDFGTGSDDDIPF